MTEPTTEQATTYTVLFVDDEPNILRAIKRALFTMDITLLLADSGAKALDLMSKHDVHVVISDMKMPQMSGAELLEQVAINYPETFRVVLTGYADIESTIKAVNQFVILDKEGNKILLSFFIHHEENQSSWMCCLEVNLES